jgi:xanthine dehydrogenase small subunit
LSRFILNHTEITTAVAPGTLLLDFIRYHQQLTGTKIGCREGDCGACTVLVGEIKNDELVYSSATSCLMPVGNAYGKHIVTIEGLNGEGLNAVQQAFADEGATQCGFCTPGFIVSLAGFCINSATPGYDKAIDAMNGNICRCTGYKSIERAAGRINGLMEKRNGAASLSFAVENNIIPGYFLEIKDRLKKLQTALVIKPTNGIEKKLLGGGTDLYVQQHETMAAEHIDFLFDKHALNGITQEGDICVMGASVTAAGIATSPIFIEHFPQLEKYIKLVSSTPIRNMATLAGNFCNASPIGDFTIFFLALDAQLLLSNGTTTRAVQLRKFYKGYKQLDKMPDEFVEKISFRLPSPNSFFNFEKVCKRTYLDIASVNTAIHLEMNGEIIVKAGIAAGGVGPVPLYLEAASDFLKGRKVDDAVINELLHIIQSEISPISDARGTAAYKRLLLNQLIKAHLKPLTPKGEPKK